MIAQEMKNEKTNKQKTVITGGYHELFYVGRVETFQIGRPVV